MEFWEGRRKRDRERGKGEDGWKRPAQVRIRGKISWHLTSLLSHKPQKSILKPEAKKVVWKIKKGKESIVNIG